MTLRGCWDGKRKGGGAVVEFEVVSEEATSGACLRTRRVPKIGKAES